MRISINIETYPKDYLRRIKYWIKGQVNFLTRCRSGHRIIMSHRLREGKPQKYCANCHHWVFVNKYGK